MKYKITFKADIEKHRDARDEFWGYMVALRDGLALADDSLGIYPDYQEDVIVFEVTVTDNLLELSADKHFRFVNMLKSALYDYIDLFACEKID